MRIIDLGSLSYFRVTPRAGSLFSVHLLVPMIEKKKLKHINNMLRFTFIEYLICA